jgi:hypothetical protein
MACYVDSSMCTANFRYTCAGYQTTYHSETQQGTGHWEGVVFQQQFARALQVMVPLLYASLPALRESVVRKKMYLFRDRL